MPDNPSGQLTASNGIGALRWFVTLYRRDQSPADDLALAENLVRVATVHANIEPTYPSTFYQSTQVDTPVTHMIAIRWQDYPATIDVVTRVTEPAPSTDRFGASFTACAGRWNSPAASASSAWNVNPNTRTPPGRRGWHAERPIDRTGRRSVRRSARSKPAMSPLALILVVVLIVVLVGGGYGYRSGYVTYQNPIGLVLLMVLVLLLLGLFGGPHWGWW